MNTTPCPFSRAVMARMTSAVNVSQPFLEWDAALCARTVRLVLSQRTPSCARGERSLVGKEVNEAGVSGGCWSLVRKI